jgi:hypothetical protein
MENAPVYGDHSGDGWIEWYLDERYTAHPYNTPRLEIYPTEHDVATDVVVDPVLDRDTCPEANDLSVTEIARDP